MKEEIASFINYFVGKTEKDEFLKKLGQSNFFNGYVIIEDWILSQDLHGQ